MVTFRLSLPVHHMSYSLPSMFIFFWGGGPFMLLLSYFSFFCSISLSSLLFPPLMCWPGSLFFAPTATHKFPVFIPLQPPFHYACPTNYSSLIPQFSQLQHSPHIHAVALLPASLPSKNKKLQNKSPKALGSKYPLEKRL